MTAAFPSQEAKALIRAIDKEYPRGYLATLRQN